MPIDSDPSLTKDHVVTLTIEKLVDGGAGMGRLAGRVVFVPGACPGEAVQARLTLVKKGYAEARLESVLQSSVNRVIPPCPVFGRCGGCQWQQLDYPSQLASKLAILQEDLSRIGKLPGVPVLSPLPASDPWSYRTRIQLKVELRQGKPMLGFFGMRSHAIVDTETCLIASPPLIRCMSILREILSSMTHRIGSLEEIHLHHARGTGELQVRYFGGEETAERLELFFDRLEDALPEIVSQVYYAPQGNRWVWGRDYLMEQYKEVPFRINDRSFAQVNWDQNRVLIDTVCSFAGLSGRESVLEVYCGIGTFGLFLAQRAAALTGIDENPFAIKDAKYNAKQMGLTNCRWIAQPVRQALSDLIARKEHFDCVVLDPPRDGVDQKVLEGLCSLRPSRIILVSCNPATLSRDLRFLMQNGFRPETIQPVDLFPQTFHLEAVASVVPV